MSRRKSRIGAGIPAPNDDVTMPIGAKMLTEAGQMHVPGCDPGTCPDLVPGPVLHVHGQVPLPRVEVNDGGNHGLGAVLVLTYGPHAQERCEDEDLQQLRACHPRFVRSETVCRGAEGTLSGGSGPVRMT